MAEINCQFVRPDKLVFEGPVASLVLVTKSGELGVWPGRAPIICALGDGVVRLHETAENGGGERDVVVSGGYAEVKDDTVIILADHARQTDDIDADVVQKTRGEAIDARDALPEDDHRRAYYDGKVAWCNLLLKQVDTRG